MNRPNETWSDVSSKTPVDGFRVVGHDATLAQAAQQSPGAVIEFIPGIDSDLALGLGISLSSVTSTELIEPAHRLVPLVSMDALEVSRGGKHTIAVNMVISGVLPDRGRWWHRRRRLSVFVDGKIIFAGRATTVIAANGQFFHGLDLIPRGHPGDSCIEVQILALPVGQRRAFKRRLATGTHVPHPGVIEGRGRRVEVSWRGRRSLNIDGRDQDIEDSIVVDVRPNAYQLARRSTP